MASLNAITAVVPCCSPGLGRHRDEEQLEPPLEEPESHHTKTMKSSAIDFFCKCQCACQHSSRFPRCLCLSACTFTMPAWLLVQQGDTILGSCAFILFLTSVAYHWTHNTKFRVLDVLMVWLVGTLGVMQCVTNILAHGANPWLILALLGIALVVIIDAFPFFYITIKSLEVIALHWHVTLHLLCTLSLLCVALGEHAFTANATNKGWLLQLTPQSVTALLAAAVGAGIVPVTRACRVGLRKIRSTWQSVWRMDSKSLLPDSVLPALPALVHDERHAAIVLG